jgi:hypothetical protein
MRVSDGNEVAVTSRVSGSARLTSDANTTPIGDDIGAYSSLLSAKQQGQLKAGLGRTPTMEKVAPQLRAISWH